MTNYKIGICLVISNSSFDGDIKKELYRAGTGKDEESIAKTFTSQGFDVQIRQNVTFAGMDKVVEEIKSKIKERDKLIAVFVMSHGDEEGILTRDRRIFKLEDLFKEFYNDECPLLNGKPKLFFINACQGENKNWAVKGVVKADSISKSAIYFPKVSDLFFGYATYKSFKSYRCPTDGSLYIQSLCEAITSSETGSIHDIHSEVNEQVKNNLRHDDLMDEESFQTPYFVSMLDKSNYYIFNPKPH